MRENREENMTQCLDEIEEINKRLTCSLRKCEELVDLPSPLGGHDEMWRDIAYTIKRIITSSEGIVQKKRELLNKYSLCRCWLMPCKPRNARTRVFSSFIYCLDNILKQSR
jgi:hypothetical protein